MTSYRYLTLAPLLCLAAVASAEVPTAARKAIDARYQQLDKAYLRKDIVKIEQAFAPDCVIKMVGEPMRVSLPQFIQGTKGSFNRIKVLHSATRIVSLKEEKNQVVATITWTRKLRFTEPNQNGKGATTAVNEGEQTIVDTWMKTARGWQIQNRLIKAKD